MGRSPYKIGSFLNSVLLSFVMDPSAHRMHLAHLHIIPMGTGGHRRMDVNIMPKLPAVPWFVNRRDAAFGFVVSLPAI